MAAQSIGVFTIAFPDPTTLSHSNNDLVTLPPTVSFRLSLENNIRTLSTNGVSKGSTPHGLLYVPSLQSDDCKDIEKQHVPNNVTRVDDLPHNMGYSLVAFAPWLKQPKCIQQYLASARNQPTKAFIVYQPGNSTDVPPPMNDPSWGLGDGGSWKRANPFPVYAISSIYGAIVMKELKLYSGNVTEAPYGNTLLSIYNPSSPTDYIRLWATVNTGSGTELPSLWVFLVIVLGLLIAIVGATSFFMHLVQRRRRNDLRQRIVNGEVDLEALGIKRLTVPREYLEQMPLHTYVPRCEPSEVEKEGVPDDPRTSPPDTSSAVRADTGLKTPAPLPSNAHASADMAPPAPSAFSQPTCPICLDDFEPSATQVRELPCRHIFHPDCVDTFLLSNSSLCPMCKTSVLPAGSCPAKITNVMVRRERMIRRMRERSTANQGSTGGQTGHSPVFTSSHPWPLGSIRSHIGGAIRQPRRVFSAPERSTAVPVPMEMGRVDDVNRALDEEARPATAGATQTSTIQQADTRSHCEEETAHIPNRREWARLRALALLGHGQAPFVDVEEGEADRRPAWRRGLRRMFPGFR
ncbi:hypothetical protein GQ43DRAFT_417529 [Delitschia confertaspora ATCC 74209]|uniref:RING-type domain-containing protein n=1 Tax=Delitschia confertaspora ATCC 74209 TaxID=1513339 RepID=A0A9P4JQB9_9PLEO|nr:hypothetical protein GQ43DRAFT_417529 [Delitschia confertaspora ATCC 74209]